MNELVIRKPKLDEWREYKEIRLMALKLSPTAFSSDYEQNLVKNDQQWKERIEQSELENESFMLCGFINGKIVSICGAYWDNSPKIKHSCNLVSVFVHPEFRNKGIASKLCEEIIKMIKKKGFMKVKLEVTEGNTNAQNLYKKLGFVVTGVRKAEILYEGKFYDEVEMELYFNNSED